MTINADKRHKTDGELVEHLGFDSEEDFTKWIHDSIDEKRVHELKRHRFCHFAGIYPLDHPCCCDCGLTGGHPDNCEHVWDGPDIEDSFGGVGVTCSNCFMPFISHLLRTGP